MGHDTIGIIKTFMENEKNLNEKMISVMHKNVLKEKNELIKSLLENTKRFINKNWTNPIEVKRTVISSLANYEADLNSQKHKITQEVKKSNVVNNSLDEDPDYRE